VEGCDDIVIRSGVVGDEIGEGVLSGEVGGPRGVRSKGSITRKEQVRVIDIQMRKTF